MEQIVAYIRALIDSGHAYVAPYASDGVRADVFFRVRSDERYGSLSHRRLQEMDQGEEVEGSERKRDPLDFSLWKARKPQEDTFWPSPWGEGRPGWHIECSAMAETELGLGFDIHGGGSDLVFPHHENEAAQTRAARGRELARLWVHNGMVQFTGEKMAKSVGNIAPLHEVLDRYGRDAVVLYLASGHYRQPLAFSDAALEQARANVNRIREAGRRLEPGASPAELGYLRDRFFEALADDFNPPAAIGAMNEWIRQASGPGYRDNRPDEHRGEPSVEHRAKPGDEHLREMLGVLGLADLLAPAREAPAEVKDLVSAREAARARRDFETADRLREEVAALGFDVRDGPQGPELIPRV
jgi:cysteinyl-tRNA synthetase